MDTTDRMNLGRALDALRFVHADAEESNDALTADQCNTAIDAIIDILSRDMDGT